MDSEPVKQTALLKIHSELNKSTLCITSPHSTRVTVRAENALGSVSSSVYNEIVDVYEEAFPFISREPLDQEVTVMDGDNVQLTLVSFVIGFLTSFFFTLVCVYCA